VVGRLVLGEPNIAVDSERRPGRVTLERDAQRLEWLLEEALVVGLAWLEPGPLIVVGDVDQELDGLGSEAGEWFPVDGYRESSGKVRSQTLRPTASRIDSHLSFDR
jgi:hypothetical protein